MPFSRPLEGRGSGARFFSPETLLDFESSCCPSPVAAVSSKRRHIAPRGLGKRVSSYAVSDGGSLALLDAVAASTGTGSAPTDLALSDNSRFLYALNSGNGTISGFRVQADGSLTPVTSATGLPAGAAGIAAR